MVWRKEIKYDEYFLDLNMKLEAAVEVKIINLKENASESSKATMEEFNFQNILNKYMKVLRLNENGVAVFESGYKFPIALQDFNIEVKINGASLNKEGIMDLIDELKAKNSPKEIEILRTTTVKSGEYFQYGKDILREYYFSNEENFEKFKSLIFNNNFCLPSSSKDKQDLIKFIEKKEPEVKNFLISHIPTIEERMLLLKSMDKESNNKLKL